VRQRAVVCLRRGVMSLARKAQFGRRSDSLHKSLAGAARRTLRRRDPICGRSIAVLLIPGWDSVTGHAGARIAQALRRQTIGLRAAA
jgi:hypothetical protein